MVENQLINLEWVGVILALIFGLTMFYQGHLIFHQKNGYSRKEIENPEARDRIRRQVEKVLKDQQNDSSTR